MNTVNLIALSHSSKDHNLAFVHLTFNFHVYVFQEIRMIIGENI